VSVYAGCGLDGDITGVVERRNYWDVPDFFLEGFFFIDTPKKFYRETRLVFEGGKETGPWNVLDIVVAAATLVFIEIAWSKSYVTNRERYSCSGADYEVPVQGYGDGRQHLF
jgi:hypothetical protein